MDQNEKKSSQLGMPNGTAANRLRKIVLFNVLKRHSENVCFKCGESINSPDELSIEHKMPWLDSDSPYELFFDVNNIAFSHLSCNCSSRRNTRTDKAPDDMAWCCDHQDYLPRDMFSLDVTRSNGLYGVCKKCHADRRERNKNHKFGTGNSLQTLIGSTPIPLTL